MSQIDLKNCTFTLSDGSATAKTFEIKIGEGNLTWTVARNIEYTLDRGDFDEVREGDKVPMDVSFDFVWEYLKPTSSEDTIEGGIKGGTYVNPGWVSSDADACRPYAVDIIVENDPGACGDTETYTFNDFRFESLAHDMRAGTVSCTGKCNSAEPTITRVV